MTLTPTDEIYFQRKYPQYFDSTAAVDRLYNVSGIGMLKPRDDGSATHTAFAKDSTPVVAYYESPADRWIVDRQGVVSTLEDVGYGNLTEESGSHDWSVWRVVHQVDAFGNEVTYDYSVSAGSAVQDPSVRVGRLVQVTMGQPGGSHWIRARFEYADAAHAQTVVMYGEPVHHDQVLSQVVVERGTGFSGSASWQPLWAYEMAREVVDGVDLVAGIDRRGHDELGDTLVESLVSFDYTPVVLEGPRHTESAVFSTYSASSSRQSVFYDPNPVGKSYTYAGQADLNGDGLLDRISDAGNTGLVPTDSSGDSLDATIATVGSSHWDFCVATLRDDGTLAYDVCEADVSGPPAGVSESITLDGTTYSVSSLADLDGDGYQDVVVSDGSTAGGNTYFSVYYGQPWNPGDPHAPFEAASEQEWSPGWTYQGTSYRPDVYTLTLENRGVVRTLFDLDGDGWLDQVDFSTNRYHAHLGERGLGWAATSQSFEHAPGAMTEFRYTVVADPVAQLLGETDSPKLVISETRQVHGILDLNGDGCPDAVDAVTTPWDVHLGRCDGTGFGPTLSWSSPLDDVQVAFEPYPTTLYAYSGWDPLDVCTDSSGNVVSCVDTYTQDGDIVQRVHDVDGDGLADLVVARGAGLAPHVYRNLGDGLSNDMVAAL